MDWGLPGLLSGRLISRWVLATIVICVPFLAADAEESTLITEDSSQSWLANYDPTLIGRRVVSEFSYEEDSNGRTTAKIENSARFAASPWKDVAVGMQILLPVQWSTTESGSASGLGDFEFLTGFYTRLSPSVRWGSGLKVKFPTATNPALGSKTIELKPILAVSWDVLSRFNVGFSAEYSITPSNPGAGGVNKLELNFPIAYKFDPVWSAALTYKPTFEFNTARIIQKMRVNATRLFGAQKQFALSPAVELPLSSQSFQWKVSVALSWYF